MSDVKYITVNSPSLTLKINGKRHKAVNGVFENLSPSDEAELDRMMKTLPHIRVEVRKVDLEEAAAKAKAILDKTPRAAVQGVVTSGTQAAAILRDAKKQQETQALTGFDNPVNTTTKPEPKKMEVTEMQVNAPKKPMSFAGLTKS